MAPQLQVMSAFDADQAGDVPGAQDRGRGTRLTSNTGAFEGSRKEKLGIIAKHWETRQK